MRTVRLALLAVVPAILLSGSALAQSDSSLAAPQGLKPFLLRASEPAARDFPRTPSFSWAPVRGATRYEFQLAKTPTFQEGTIFWASSLAQEPRRRDPADPALDDGRAVRRLRTGAGGDAPAARSPWSAGYGFNVQWQHVPTQSDVLPGPRTLDAGRGRDELPGLVHRHQPRRRDPRQRRRPARVLRVPPEHARSPARSTGASAPSVGSRSCRASSRPSTTGRGARRSRRRTRRMADGVVQPGRRGDGARHEHADAARRRTR